MARHQSRILVVTALAAGLACCSCDSLGLDAGASRDGTIAALNAYLLGPQKTCESLRVQFNLEGLSTVDTPDQAGIVYEEHFVPLDDGTVLRAWYLPSPMDRGVVVLSYGAVGVMPCYLFTTSLLLDQGWSVVMYDYRGFGGSTGQPSIAHMTEDLENVVDWFREYSGEPRVTLMGISLGTVPVVAVAARRPDAVNGVVLDSPFDLAASVRRAEFVLRQTAERVINGLEDDLLSDRIIHRVSVPSLFYSNENDGLTPPRQVEDLFERAGGAKRLAEMPGVGHARGVFLQTDMYAFYLDDFLSDVWSEPTAPADLASTAPQHPVPSAASTK